jgi:hypothetical protein
MKYYNFIELKTLRLNKKIDMDSEELMLPVTLTDKDIEEIEYEPDKLSQKVFSFSLWFEYYGTVKKLFDPTYIYGLIFNYRIFLKYHEKFDGYKFRVYIDKKSFFENPYYLFYLSYLKKLEIELIKSKETNYEFLELILCDFPSGERFSFMIAVLRFLPFFEGRECHCRDLDFRLSSYDIEIIKIFNDSNYPIYSVSPEQSHVNSFLAGCWGGNLQKKFTVNEKSKINNGIFSFFTVNGLICLSIVYSNLFKDYFGFDEFLLCLYMAMLSDCFLENCLVFGVKYIDFMRDYVSDYYVCANKFDYNTHKQHGEIPIIGQILTNDFFNLLRHYEDFHINPLITSFKLNRNFSRSLIRNQFQQYKFLQNFNNGFTEFNDPNNVTYSDCIFDLVGKCFDNKEINSNTLNLLDEQLRAIKPYLSGNIVDPILKIINLDLYSFVDSKIFNEPVPFEILTGKRCIIHPYFYNHFSKPTSIYETDSIISEMSAEQHELYLHKHFNTYDFSSLIKTYSTDNEPQIISIPIDSVISYNGNVIFNIDMIPRNDKFTEERLKSGALEGDLRFSENCYGLTNHTNKLKFILFPKSRNVFIFIFNSNEFKKYVSPIKICLFGKPFIHDLTITDVSGECDFFTIDKLEFRDNKNEIFDPLKIGIIHKQSGGSYYKKYIKYKNKYLMLRDSMSNHVT